MFHLVAVDLSHSSCGSRVTPPDAIWDRPAKPDKMLKNVAKTYGPFTEGEWIEFSKTPLQKRLFFLTKIEK